MSPSLVDTSRVKSSPPTPVLQSLTINNNGHEPDEETTLSASSVTVLSPCNADASSLCTSDPFVVGKVQTDEAGRSLLDVTGSEGATHLTNNDSASFKDVSSSTSLGSSSDGNVGSTTSNVENISSTEASSLQHQTEPVPPKICPNATSIPSGSDKTPIDHPATGGTGMDSANPSSTSSNAMGFAAASFQGQNPQQNNSHIHQNHHQQQHMMAMMMYMHHHHQQQQQQHEMMLWQHLQSNPHLMQQLMMQQAIMANMMRPMTAMQAPPHIYHNAMPNRTNHGIGAKRKLPLAFESKDPKRVKEEEGLACELLLQLGDIASDISEKEDKVVLSSTSGRDS
jgi:hypothetical protein